MAEKVTGKTLESKIHIDTRDKSFYLKGLLILIGKDRKISETERNLVVFIGRSLGFERKFCETAVSELLDNKYITDEPPKFSHPLIAESFIIDGLHIAVSDKELNPEELEFLIATARENNLSTERTSSVIRENLSRTIENQEPALLINRFI